MPIDLHTLASASFLSREDRRAYLKAMEAEARRAPAAEFYGQPLDKGGRDLGPRVGPFATRDEALIRAKAAKPRARSWSTWRGPGALDIRNTRNTGA